MPTPSDKRSTIARLVAAPGKRDELLAILSEGAGRTSAPRLTTGAQ